MNEFEFDNKYVIRCFLFEIPADIFIERMH